MGWSEDLSISPPKVHEKMKFRALTGLCLLRLLTSLHRANLRSFPSQTCIFGEWKVFDEGGLGCLGVGFDDVFVDIMYVTFLSSEKVSVPVSPLFFLASALHNCFDGTEVDQGSFLSILARELCL